MDSLIIFAAKYLFVFVGLIGLYVWFRQSRDKKIELALVFITATIIALVIAKILGKFYYDPRPFVTHTFKPLIKHIADNGFPSDHTVGTVTVSTLLFFYNRNWAIVAFILSLLVGIGRVAALVHSPIDIVGGALIGIAAGLAGFYLIRWLRPEKKPEKSPA